MRSDGTSVNLISDGTLMIDGGTAFGQVPKTQWETQIKPDRKNRIRMSMNSLVIKTEDANILVDTGAGSKRTDLLKETCHINGNKLIRGLKEVNLTARDIDLVILTHLHFDHCGGCTKLDRSGQAIPIFPKAKYVVQKSCWDGANQPNERNSGVFFKDDFAPLEDKGQLELVSGDKEIAPGVTLKLADGPSRGHQMVFINMGSERIVFAGDLLPTPHHLPPEYIPASDEFPNETLVQKKELLQMAIDDGWLLVFGHGQEYKSGYIEERNGRTLLLPKDV